MIPRHELTSLPAEVLAAYPRLYFIETGTNTGHGVERAKARRPPYEMIWSIERDETLWRALWSRYQDTEPVRLLQGESPACLRRILDGLEAPAVIYLDAHTETDNPLLEELSVIADAPPLDHVILIDDVRMFGHTEMPGWRDVTHAAVSAALQAINPAYTVLFADTVNGEKDLLIAATEHPERGPGQ